MMGSTRIVANAFCFLPGALRSPNLVTRSGKDLVNTYLKNSFVSLKTARLAEPEARVLLVTNHAIPDDFRSLFESAGIEILPLPFERYLLPEGYPWRLAYYKLDVLERLAETEGQILLLDTDTLVVEGLEDLWEEARTQVLLFDPQHRFSHPSRSDIRNLGRELFDAGMNPLHWGGEAVTGRAPELRRFLGHCWSVFLRLKENLERYPSDRDQGDEAVISLAAWCEPALVGHLNAYLGRYWTGRNFNLMSTNYKWNPVSIWHVPAEKHGGMLHLFDHLVAHDALPDREVLYRMLHFEKGDFRILKDMVRKRFRG